MLTDCCSCMHVKRWRSPLQSAFNSRHQAVKAGFPAAACGLYCSATVWRARCLTNNQIVAVKILNLEAQIAPLEDIVHEAQTMKVRWGLDLMPPATNTHT